MTHILTFFDKKDFYMTFREYCIEHNVQILKDDTRFLRESLKKMPFADRKRVSHGYVNRWIEELNKEQATQNNARRAANNWLLDKLDSFTQR
jgi:hypothetical protein